jgi:hypothetical protein
MKAELASESSYVKHFSPRKKEIVSMSQFSLQLCPSTDNKLIISVLTVVAFSCPNNLESDFFFNNQPGTLIIPRRVRMELQFHPDSPWKWSSKTWMKLLLLLNKHYNSCSVLAFSTIFFYSRWS